MLPVIGNRQIYGSQFSDLSVAALGIGFGDLISLLAALHTSLKSQHLYSPIYSVGTASATRQWSRQEDWYNHSTPDTVC